MSRYTNATGIPLSVAVWLATDNYDYLPGTISATSLLRPIRQQILAGRVPPEEAKADILSLFKARLGTALHDSIERAWLQNYEQAMRDLAYPDHVIDRIVINPEPGKVAPDAIPVYMEQRVTREHRGYKITGKFDLVAEGRVEDYKSTSAFTWMEGTKDDDYQLQGSIYRWLSPDIITEDHMAVHFLFTDWAAKRAKTEAKYPSRPIEVKRIPLLSLDETEQYINERLSEYEFYKDRPEDQIPECTEKELWQREPVYKYYKNPNNKNGRSTKNFKSMAEAIKRLNDDGNVGEIVTIPGEVNACKYCPAFAACTQKDRLMENGQLIF